MSRTTILMAAFSCNSYASPNSTLLATEVWLVPFAVCFSGKTAAMHTKKLSPNRLRLLLVQESGLTSFVSVLLQALHNPSYRAQCNKVDDSGPSEAKGGQPWQLVAMQEAADFSNANEDGAGRYGCVAELLSGMLHPDAAKRMTARQLAEQQQWLRVAGTSELGPCPAVLQKILQK